jgi:hypothetical protein
LEPGAYEIRVHAGTGGAFGWSEPLPLTIRGPARAAPDAVVNWPSGNVLRHNSLVRRRSDGLLVNGNRPADSRRCSPAVIEQNTVEGVHGVEDRSTILEQRGPNRPKPSR